MTTLQTYNGHTYRLTSQPMTWTAAEAEAISLGGHLVTINDSEENQWVYNTFSGDNMTFWIGITDQTSEGVWRWADGSTPTYTSWNYGEPNNLGGEDYTQMLPGYGGLWNDLSNNYSMYGVIEISGSTITGDNNNNNLIGTENAETITGLGGNDTLTGNAGDDTLDGSEGTDTAVFAKSKDSYLITYANTDGGKITVTDLYGSTAGEKDTLISIEKIQFADQTVSWDSAGKTFTSIVNQDGYYSTFATLAKAAYHLSGNETVGPGKNFQKAYADNAWGQVHTDWEVLKPTDISVAGGNLSKEGMFTSGNAAAFAVRSADALVISFRGTNDNDDGSMPTPDMISWAKMSGHYENLRPFVNSIDAYAASNGINKIYVTGHSLGGGMALGYMLEHPESLDTGIKYEAVTFAAPGFDDLELKALVSSPNLAKNLLKFLAVNIIDDVIMAFRNDKRILCLEVDGDPVPDINVKQGITVSIETQDLKHPDGTDYSFVDFHSMDIYAMAAKAMDDTLPYSQLNTGSTILHGVDLNYRGVGTNIEISMPTQEVIPPSFAFEKNAAGVNQPWFSYGTGNNTVYESDNIGTTDYFFGGAGNDILGAKRTEIIGTTPTNAWTVAMFGGSGDDQYYVHNTKDQVSERSTFGGQHDTGGKDTIIAWVNYTLPSYVENISLTGTDPIYAIGNELDNLIIGNAAANTLKGLAGSDTMIGGDGDDKYYIDVATDRVRETSLTDNDTIYSSISYSLTSTNNVENLMLTGTSTLNALGNAYANRLYGNSAANILNGREGNDSMSGGAGDDKYYVDSTLDKISEATNAGDDIVYSTASFTLQANLEALILTGTDHLAGTGNASNNRITGNTGNNKIDGGAGVDTMIGGNGNDEYRIDVNESVIEYNGTAGGIDRVYSSADGYALASSVEELVLTGNAITGFGNSADNMVMGNAFNNAIAGGFGNDVLYGLSGNDTITGGSGYDSLSGGAGIDTFFFKQAGDIGTSLTSCDTVTDFKSREDKLDLSGLDANTATTADNAFTTKLVSSFTGAGQLRFSNGVLYGNTDSDSTAEFVIKLSGVTSLMITDIIC